ncbi:hypothetical protein EDD36DRAFT_245018 [Exophiala viscosa]|uniref:Uncharacterized protein n=1 Tax=Exophiala viscosa TaxID=2486360 RepID=A0AAN6DUD9_9EURO|nr:hypothetical protein EDD36DRAFT_245018 [Exophiala viscosa]
MCDCQKAGSTTHTNFTALGKFLVLSFGCLIIGLNLCLPTATRKLRRKLAHPDEAEIGWEMDEILQLQRLAFEIAGMGTWRASSDGKGGMSVPTTLTDEQLPRLHHSVGARKLRRYTYDSPGEELIGLHPYRSHTSSVSGAKGYSHISEDVAATSSTYNSGGLG